MCKGLEVQLSGVFGKPGASLLSTGNTLGVAQQPEQLGLKVLVDVEGFEPRARILKPPKGSSR